MALRIEDYALIGDCRTAALVGKDGSIDWFCAPRFDSGAAFAALLGTSDHGRFLLTSATPPERIRRRYRTDTLVLETELKVPTGIVRIVDCMPTYLDTPAIVRVVEG